MVAASNISETPRNLKKRYSDAYLVSKVTVNFGNLIKIIGVLLAGMIIVGALFMASQGPGVFVVGGIVVAGLSGLLFYLLGVLIAANGQVLQATLDSAVNSSPFLTDADRAEVMSLTIQGLEARGTAISTASTPEIPEGYKFSADQAAQAIAVTRGTFQDYIKSGRINANPDGTIDAAELLRAGFIIRNFPPRSA